MSHRESMHQVQIFSTQSQQVDPNVCACEDPICLSGGRSPFTKLIVFDYYDGPLGGMTQCELCGSVYRFDSPEEAWDFKHGSYEVRIFTLSRLPHDSFRLIVDAIPEMGPPSWPVWVPLWNFASEARREAADRVVDAVRSRAAQPHLVVAAIDLSEKILRAKRVTPDEIIAIDDWAAFVGLAE